MRREPLTRRNGAAGPEPIVMDFKVSVENRCASALLGLC
jgi:hypothetical protein